VTRPYSDLLSIGDHVEIWARQVSKFIDVPLKPEHRNLDDYVWELHDYEGYLANRDFLEEKLAGLPVEVRRNVEAWLSTHADADFLAMTEPDHDKLLQRAMVDQSDSGPWNSRVPKRGLMRALLEHQARRINYNADDEATSSSN
jgi:hypothetical protein